MSCRSMGRTGVMSDSSAQASSVLDQARANDLIPVGDPLTTDRRRGGAWWRRDTVDGGDGADIARGGDNDGNGTVQGGPGNDNLAGGSGVDTIDGATAMTASTARTPVTS